MFDARAVDRTFELGGAGGVSTMLGVFLSDSELVTTLEDTDLVTGLEVGEGDNRFGADAPVQPCSIDLRIGGIHIPGVERHKPGSADNPQEGVILRPGKTAVITTQEQCNLPSGVGAIGFPPNSVSSKGILMTNPGHVDPGYQGPMTFTVINMGEEEYSLIRGNKIVTLLFFELKTTAKRDLAARGKGYAGVDGTLDYLAPDFLGIEKRVKEAAKTEENKTQRYTILGTIFVGILAVIASFLYSTIPLRGDVSDLKASTATLGDVKRLEKEVETLRGDLDREGLPLPVEGEGE